MLKKDMNAVAIVKDYISDFKEYKKNNNTFNSKIMDNWKIDIKKLEQDKKNDMYNIIIQRMKAHADAELYEDAQIIKEAWNFFLEYY
ncbi:TPA: hypothetical protein HA235_03960 [Candidatus Woesearchaeota archaeon]|nr:hypothetical protein [uncultured archaeon]MBS3173332.1 hypothetical protein [Candidatus Woesearchaeota archaeon]HIH31838.1 hypothetical protein [Candidatus Woesearchaeota archaeon]HIH55449.1 hypothetical protein [Candidatus Woesearchaeota archaeon]HIJ01911.1 hypothetical protein [Candidatus Woesearchaeota archaeon]